MTCSILFPLENIHLLNFEKNHEKKCEYVLPSGWVDHFARTCFGSFTTVQLYIVKSTNTKKIQNTQNLWTKSFKLDLILIFFPFMSPRVPFLICSGILSISFGQVGERIFENCQEYTIQFVSLIWSRNSSSFIISHKSKHWIWFILISQKPITNSCCLRIRQKQRNLSLIEPLFCRGILI